MNIQTGILKSPERNLLGEFVHIQTKALLLNTVTTFGNQEGNMMI